MKVSVTVVYSDNEFSMFGDYPRIYCPDVRQLRKRHIDTGVLGIFWVELRRSLSRPRVLSVVAPRSHAFRSQRSCVG